MRLNWYYFGNGRGMASPYWDDVFYWLKDMKRYDREKAKGQFYRLVGGYGAQLESYEWFKPAIEERRLLAGIEFRAFSATRRGLIVRISWQRIKAIEDIEDLRLFESTIKNWGHGT